MTTEQRLQDAIRAKAQSIDPASDGWAHIERRLQAAPRRSSRPLLLAAAAAVVLVALAAAAWLPGDRGGGTRRLRVGPSDQPVATTTPPTTPTTAPAGPPTTTAGVAASSLGTSQPLWPFGSEGDVASWQESYRSGGHQPWHLDPAQTALAFTNGYLGFDEIDRVVSKSVGAADARIGVGYENPNQQPVTAAVIHLVRWGSGADAPWEVVGTRDTEGISLTLPKYGSTVTSPVEVGGVITGVDESIHVQVRSLDSPTPIGDACCLPAGGQATPWHTTVSFRPAGAGVVTVVAWTGGHLQGVERFAITGLRVSG